MALTVPNEGEVEFLKRLTRKTVSTDLLLDLFSSDTTPNSASTLSDFTLCTGGGYAQKSLANTVWTITPGSPSLANASPQQFLWSSVPPVTNVYGYIVHTNGAIVAVERLPVNVAPFVINAANDSITIVPQITCGSATND